MVYQKIEYKEIGAWAEISLYTPEQGVQEFHVLVHIQPQHQLFEGQLERLYQAQDKLLQTAELQGATCIMKRYFVSDATNQQPLMKDEPDCAVSVIQQPCLDGSKVAVWMYLQKGSKIYKQNDAIVAEHNGYQHIYRMGYVDNQGGSYVQTESVMNQYEQLLNSMDATMEANCIRTWFFVRDVDIQYEGLVKARKDLFTQLGLTQHTHYITSTGIGGLPADPKAIVQLGTYALKGFEPAQQRYLYAPTHLNPTYEYGVTFERGTLLEYGDRKEVFISGTASINNKGEVVHIGDIVNQTYRMWENVEKLLEEAGTTFQDVSHLIVYLRDLCDYQTVRDMFADRFPDIPTVITLAPVCRPTWLIEMECMATVRANNPQFRNF